MLYVYLDVTRKVHFAKKNSSLLFLRKFPRTLRRVPSKPRYIHPIQSFPPKKACPPFTKTKLIWVQNISSTATFSLFSWPSRYAHLSIGTSHGGNKAWPAPRPNVNVRVRWYIDGNGKSLIFCITKKT